ncbi:MAG: patatin-like phospholipase family protein [Gammaproteobacteria bacterium]
MFNREQIDILRNIYKLSNTRIENLVLEGGSVRGFAHIGVIDTLEKAKILPQLKRIAGSSIGALIAFAVAIGYNAKELEDISLQIDVPSFFDFTSIDPKEYYVKNNFDSSPEFAGKTLYNAAKYLFLFSKSMADTYRLKGIFNGNYIEQIVRSLIQKQFPNKTSLTFNELHQLALKDPTRYKDLYLTGVDILNHEFVVFSHEKTPNMPIETAVHISMSFPGLFKTVEYAGRYYLDGGLYNNLAMELFDNKTIGIALSTTQRTQKMHEAKRDTNQKLTWMQFFTLMAMSPLDAQDALRNKEIRERTIYINLEDIFLFNAFVTKSQICQMINRGKETSQTYLKERQQKMKNLLMFYLLSSPQFKNYLSHHSTNLFKPSPIKDTPLVEKKEIQPPKKQKPISSGIYLRTLKTTPIGLSTLMLQASSRQPQTYKKSIL